MLLEACDIALANLNRAEARHNDSAGCLPGSGRHISSSAFCHAASRKSAQQEGHSKASSALTHARKESRLQQRADSWIEVVHKETGQVYYWNEHTSESQLLALV